MVEGNGNIFFDINDKNFAIGPVGIGEVSDQNGVFVAPNPASGSFEVVIKEGSEFYKTTNVLEVIDITGRVVLSETLSDGASKG
jgi:hypothetical protein